MATPRVKHKKKSGRKPQPVPTKTSQAILARLATGESLRSVCRDKGMPSAPSVIGWTLKDPVFAERYAECRRTGLELLADDIIDISADKEIEVSRARLMIDSRKWILSKLVPQYSDRVPGDDAGNPLHIGISDSEAAHQINGLLAAARERRLKAEASSNGNGNGSSNGNGAT